MDDALTTFIRELVSEEIRGRFANDVEAKLTEVVSARVSAELFTYLLLGRAIAETECAEQVPEYAHRYFSQATTSNPKDPSSSRIAGHQHPRQSENYSDSPQAFGTHRNRETHNRVLADRNTRGTSHCTLCGNSREPSHPSHSFSHQTSIDEELTVPPQCPTQETSEELRESLFQAAGLPQVGSYRWTVLERQYRAALREDRKHTRSDVGNRQEPEHNAEDLRRNSRNN